MADPSPAFLPEMVTGSQETCVVAGNSQGAKPLDPASIILAATPFNGLESPSDSSPSMISPTLPQFKISEDLKLPSNDFVAPGPAPFGPMDSQVSEQQKAEISGGLLMNAGPPDNNSEAGGEVGNRGEATECLPASPRSPLCFPSDEATELPASPRTHPSSSVTPACESPVSPPLLSKAPVKPLLVYSRRRFHPSKKSVVGDAAVDPTAPPLASCSRPTEAATVLPPAAERGLSDSAVGVGVGATLEAPAPMADALGLGIAQEAPFPPPPPSSVDPVASRTTFINKLARRAGGLLPVPTINKRRSKTLHPGYTSRRSRRLAGAKTEFGLNDLEGRTKKKAMRSLKLIEEHEGIDQLALDEYAKLFGQPLPDSHVQALAALFHWSLPENLGKGEDGGLLF